MKDIPDRFDNIKTYLMYLSTETSKLSIKKSTSYSTFDVSQWHLTVSKEIEYSLMRMCIILLILDINLMVLIFLNNQEIDSAYNQAKRFKLEHFNHYINLNVIIW